MKSIVAFLTSLVCISITVFSLCEKGSCAPTGKNNIEGGHNAVRGENHTEVLQFHVEGIPLQADRCKFITECNSIITECREKPNSNCNIRRKCVFHLHIQIFETVQSKQISVWFNHYNFLRLPILNVPQILIQIWYPISIPIMYPYFF